MENNESSGRAISRRHFLMSALAGAVGLSALSALAGCGSQTKAPAAATTPPSSAPTAKTSSAAAGATAATPGATASAEKPVDGGTATLPIVADPTFNPWHPNAFVESVFVNRVLFDGLTKPGKDLTPQPDLAEKWEFSSDGLTWTFHLRNGVKWSDGQPFTANDVAYTFTDIVLNKSRGANGAGNFASLKSVEAVDPTTVKFTLSRPFAALPAYLAYNAGILPQHIFQGQDPWKLNSFNKEHPVSTGPFKLESFTSGQSVVLVRNEDYFGAKPHVDKLVYKILPDPNTQLAQMLSGELNIMTLDDKAAVDRLKSATNIKVEAKPLVQFYWLSLNQTNPLFQDVKVRQALLYAIDRPAIIKSVEKGYATVANSPISPALKAYYDPSLESKYPYDPAKAKQLLADAGWKPGSDGVLAKDGQPFKFTMDVAQKGDLQPINELVQQYFKQIGIQVTLNSMEWNAYIKKDVIKRDYEAQINWWVYPSDPDVLPYFISTAAGTGWNIPGYKDPKLDDLLKKGEATSDPTQRKQVYTELQQYMSDVLPYDFLWFPEEVQVVSTNLRGVPDMNLRDAMQYANEWWIAK